MDVPGLLPPVWTASLEHTRYTLSAWPSIIAALLFCLASFFLQQNARRVEPQQLPSAFPFLLGLFPAFFLFAFAVKPAFAPETSAGALFSNAVALDSFCVFSSTLGLLTTMFLLAARPPRALYFFVSTAVPFFFCFSLALYHAHWLEELGSLPFLQLQGPGVIHAERPARIAVALYRRAFRSWLNEEVPARPLTLEELVRWELPSTMPVSASAPGVRSLLVRARSSFLLIETTVSLRVLPERAHPGFPLRVGNEWNYSVAEITGEQVLFLIPNMRTEFRSLQFRITDSIERDGLRQFQLSVNGTRQFTLVGLDGETMLLHDGQLTPFLSWDAAPDAQHTVPCTFHVPEEVLALCDAPYEGNLPGPLSWSVRRDAGIATPLFLLLTAGTLIPHATSIQAKRISTQWGPPPEATPPRPSF